MIKQQLCFLFVAVLVTNDAAAQIYQQRGSTVGGLTGAAVGAAIGEHNNEPLAGAIIGGVVGLVSGAAMGNARDREIAESRAYHQYQQQQSLARAVSSQDVVTMTHNGLSDSVIINHIRANGVRQQLQVADVIALHQQGVSEPVISAMQQGTGVAAVPSRVYQPVPQPVVVEHYAAPRYYHYPARRRFHRPRHFGHAHGPRFSFSFGR